MPNETTDITKSESFEIGLVMAGAVSAGAYTAGVVDFLLQALDAWQEAKEQGRADCPPHQVNIKVLAGASAGGITAALLAAALGGKIQPVTEVPPPDPASNKLYQAWVDKADIKGLLADRDLTGPYIKSILDSTILDDIAEEAFKIQPAKVRRSYIDDELHLYLSVTNLRGVPYEIAFSGQTGAGYGLSLHADYMHFVLRQTEIPLEESGLWLNPTDYSHPNWETLKQAAKASSAFPIGLAPRVLARQASDYTYRTWPIPLDANAAAKGQFKCQELKEIPPYWPNSFKPGGTGRPDYTFLSIDGGLLNNEPLELARRRLAGADGRNPRNPSEAKRAVMLIDPFPNYASFDPAYQPMEDIFSVMTGMFSSLIQQAQFKLDELVLACDEEIYSRFLIAPSRTDKHGQKATFPLACSALNAFGGFLSAEFRRHDFQLGRRNCQQFLRKYFALPESAQNPLFDGWTEPMKDKYRIKRNDGASYLPIIPLLDPVTTEVQPLEWPHYSMAEFERLGQMVDVRVKALGSRLIEQYMHGWLNYLARVLWWRERGRVVDQIMARIQQDLTARELMVQAYKP